MDASLPLPDMAATDFPLSLRSSGQFALLMPIPGISCPDLPVFAVDIAHSASLLTLQSLQCPGFPFLPFGTGCVELLPPVSDFATPEPLPSMRSLV